jgi:hypothetical protein
LDETYFNLEEATNHIQERPILPSFDWLIVLKLSQASQTFHANSWDLLAEQAQYQSNTSSMVFCIENSNTEATNKWVQQLKQGVQQWPNWSTKVFTCNNTQTRGALQSQHTIVLIHLDQEVKNRFTTPNQEWTFSGVR